MGYTTMILVAIVLIPIVILFALRRPSPSGPRRQRDKGVTHTEPASDEPSPASGPVNKADSKRAAERIPPS